MPTAGIRLLPDFLVIGAQRAGTSSLFKHLGRHPEIGPSLRKETEYFNRRFTHRVSWYAAHFPLEARRVLSDKLGRQLLAFEATPSYLFDPRVPSRVASLLPDAQLIVLLRNPVARTFSGWRHMRSLGFETLDFEAAIGPEGQARYVGEEDRMSEDPYYYSKPYFRFAYLERGHYADQLQRWFAAFGRSSFLIIESESFYSDPRQAYRQVTEFLGIRPWIPEEFKSYSSATSMSPIHAADEIPRHVRDRLESHFEPHNQRLDRLLRRSFKW